MKTFLLLWYNIPALIQFAFLHSEWFILLSALVIAIAIYYAFHQRERRIKAEAESKAKLEERRSQSLQYELEIEKVINYFATSLSGLRTIDEMLWDVVKKCISQLGFQDCVIYLFNADKTLLEQRAAHGPKNIDYKEIFNRIEIPAGSGIVGNVAISGVAEIINDTSKDSRYIPDDAIRLSEIAVPITGSERVMGVIDSENPQANFYTNGHLKILTAVATLVANKIDQVEAEANSRKKEIELARLQRDVATSQLTATRAQMNPHFIFNALNSVQQYILQGNTDEAIKYLSRFSRLQREILNHCDRPFISLQKEADMLKMYLELEQLRFNGTFNFFIAVDENIDPGEIKIPLMILQPFVENAIWHGLMPKEGQRKLSVVFRMVEDEEMLYCTVTDNGIGRLAASEKKKANEGAVAHVSKGLTLVYDRLHLLEQQFAKPFGASIYDRLDDDGNLSGTRVEVTLYTGI